MCALLRTAQTTMIVLHTCEKTKLSWERVNASSHWDPLNALCSMGWSFVVCWMYDFLGHFFFRHQTQSPMIFSILALVFFVARKFRAVGRVGREVWSVKFKCGVRRAQCEVWSVKCEVWSVKEAVRSVKCGLWSVKCEWSVECEVRSEKCEVWSLECEVWSGKEAVRSEKCEVWTVKCGVWSAKWEVWS